MAHPFPVDMPALVEVLSEHLYSDKRVAVRELLQNARDSLLRARSSRASLGDDPQIEVAPDPIAGTLTIADNGMGLTADEAQTFLATLARSGTRLLRNEAQPADPELAGLLGGQFGLGFFSTLIVADEVTLTSRSRTPQSQPIRWSCSKSQAGYALEPGDDDRYGTQVTLRLNRDNRHLLLPSNLVKVVRRYCDLVEFPIRMAGHPGALNRMAAPWLASDPDPALLVEYLRETGRLRLDDDPLLVAPLDLGPDSRGILFLPAHIGKSGSISLHVRRIWVADSDQYVTEGMRFVHAVVNCRDLPLTLSREDVVKGAALEQFQERLRDAVLSALAEAKRTKRRSLARVMEAYSQPIKLAALHDDRVLELFGDEIAVPLAAGGTMALGKVRELSGGQIRFVDDMETQASHAALFHAQQRPVVNAGDRLDWMLVQKYASANGDDTERADVAAKDLARSADGHEWRVLEQVVAAADPAVVPSAVVMDADVPALFMRGHEDVMRDMIQDLVRRRGDAGVLGVFMEALAGAGGEDRKRSLQLNTRHPLVAQLRDAAAVGVPREWLMPCIRALTASTEAFSEQMDPAQRRQAYETQVAFMAVALQGAIAAARAASAPKPTPAPTALAQQQPASSTPRPPTPPAPPAPTQAAEPGRAKGGRFGWFSRRR